MQYCGEMALTKAEKQVERMESRDARARAKKRAEKMQLTEFASGAGIGAVEGYLESAGFAFITDGIGPVKFEYLQTGLGMYLAYKGKGTAREIGSAMGTIGLYKVAKGFASGFSLGGLLGK